MIEIPLSRGLIAIIDDADYSLVGAHRWYALKGKNTFYAYRNIPDGKPIYMHRLILNAPTGIWVDHRDGNGLNNRRDNLRLSTATQNHGNRKLRRDSLTGYKGVQWREDMKKWTARIGVNKQPIYLGSFGDPIEAAEAYDRAARQFFGEFALCNFELNGGGSNEIQATHHYSTEGIAL